MMFMEKFSTTAPIGIELIAIALGLDPLYLILRVDNSTVNYVLTSFRILFGYRLMNDVIKTGLAMFIVGLMVVCSTNDFIRRITPRKKVIYGLKPDEATLYRELQIWNGYVNENFCYLAVPPLIFFGTALFVVAAYSSIRMPGRVSWLIYPTAPFTALLNTLFDFTLIPFAAKVYEKSGVYLTRLRMKLVKMRDRKAAKAFTPLAIEVGPFGRVKHGLLPVILKSVADNTSDLLIMF